MAIIGGNAMKRRLLSFVLLIALLFSLASCGSTIVDDPSKNQGAPSVVLPEDSDFAVHFIDVGQADASLVICDGKTMLIDGGNVADSSVIYSYLKQNNITHLDYIIATHPHEDHIGGLSGALNAATVGVAYSPVKSYDSGVFNTFVKHLSNRGVSITVPKVNDTFMLGSAKCAVLAVNTENSDPNNLSIVLRIVYGETSFLFTGDAEREVETALVAREAELESTVLKVGHHGSRSSTSYMFLREIMPKYAVIHVGNGNDYGHPTEEVLSRLRDADVTLYRTDIHGNIICVSTGKEVIFASEKNTGKDVFGGIGPNSVTDPITEPKTEPSTEPSNVFTYVINTNTGKFHYPDCSSAKNISDKNRKETKATREELLGQGYSPCGNCDP